MNSVLNLFAHKKLVPFLVVVLLNLLLLFLFGSSVIYNQIIHPSDDFLMTDIPVPQVPPPPETVTAPSTPNLPNAQAQVDFPDDPKPDIIPRPEAIPVITNTASPFAIRMSSARTFVNGPRMTMPAETSGNSRFDQAGGTSSGLSSANIFTNFGEPARDGVTLLTGFMYDMKQTRQRKPTGVTLGTYYAILRKFAQNNFRESTLNDYYRTENALSTNAVAIAPVASVQAPTAFGVEKEVQPSLWMVNYHGVVAAPETGDYIFAGYADNVLVVSINSEVVLDCSTSQIIGDPKLRQATDPAGWQGHKTYKGKTIHVEEGEPLHMNVMIGDDGGQTSFFLYLMKDGTTYQRAPKGNLILPLFHLSQGHRIPPQVDSTVHTPAWVGVATPSE